MNLWNITIDLYQEMFRQCSLNSSFVFKPNKNEVKMTIKFIKFLKEKYKKHELNTDLLIQYFEYQFSRYSGTYSYGYGKNKIMYSWVVGIKAIESWNSRDISKKWLVQYKLNNEVVLRLKKTYKSKNNILRENKRLMNFVELSPVEEIEKQRFYNTELGFVHCYNTTTLYHQKSIWCSGCDNKDKCVELLEKDYKKLKEIRDSVCKN